MKNFKSNLVFLVISLAPSALLAQSAVISDITDAVNKLSRILLVVITGCGAWAGVKMAKGDQDAVPRLILCVMGAVVVGAATALINFFKL